MIILMVLLIVSGAGLIVFILLHSGKGTGLSDMISAAVYNPSSGTFTVERNLNRITIIFAVIFIVTLIAMMILWPQGSISA